MSIWSFYSGEGTLTDRTFSGPQEYLQQNTPTGCTAIQGVFDHLSQRVDLATGEVVDYQPDAPADAAEYTWTWQDRRWVKVNTFYGEQQRVEQRIVRGFAPLTAEQERPLREIAVASATGATPPTGAIVRLQQIEARATTLRRHIERVRACENVEELAVVESEAVPVVTAPI